MKRRIISTLLALCVVMTTLPATALTVEISDILTDKELEDWDKELDDGEDLSEIATYSPVVEKIYDKRLYSVYDVPMTWEEAKVYCENLGGHLVTVTSAEEEMFIQTLISDISYHCWLGGALNTKESWMWVTQEEWNYTNWADGEPNNYLNRGENCLLLTNGEWNDQLSDGDPTGVSLEDIVFICEWETEDTPELPTTPPSQPDINFSDVNESDWFYEGVRFVCINGLMSGYDTTTFAPYDNLSRAMLAQVFCNLEGQPVMSGGSVFDDVSSDAWYANAVLWAVDRNIVSGYGNGKFGPDDLVTQEQLVTILWRYAGSPAGSGDLSSFSDSGSVSDWAADAVRWAEGNGLLAGMGDGAFQPQSGATRAQVATLMMRFCEHMGI